MAAQKRILVCAEAAAGGDWPPLAAVTVGLHRAGYTIQCFGDAGIEKHLADVPIAVECVPPEQSLRPFLSSWFAAGETGPSPLQAWVDACSPRLPSFLAEFKPDLVVSHLFSSPLAHKVKTIADIPWCCINSTFYFGQDALRDFEDDFVGAARYFLGQLRVTLAHADLVLHGTDMAFDPPPPSLPPHHHYVGPLLWEPPGDTPFFLTEPGTPWVLVALSSLPQADEISLARAALQALADQPVRVLLTLTETHPREELGTIPANARVAHYIPHSEVLKQSCLLVSHAGHGIVTKALSYGVPMVLVPWGRDQPGVAARAAALGVAEAVPRSDFAEEEGRLGMAIRQVLGTPSYRNQAEHIAQGLQAHDAVADACERIVTLFANSDLSAE